MTPSTWTRAAMLGCCASLAGTTLLAQTIKLDVVGTVPGPADLVRVSGTHAYLAAGAILRIVDISEPAAPTQRGTVQLPAAATAIAVAGSTVYATMGLRGLAIVDARNAGAPVVVGHYKTVGEALRIAAAGTKVILSDRMAGADVIDVSNPSKPVSVGSYFTDGYTRDVAIAGSLAYVVDSTNDFAIVDLSRTGEPRALATQSSSETSTFVVIASSTGSRKTAYVAGNGSLQVYDVTDPAAPRKLATTKIHNRMTAFVVDEGLCYVAAGSDGLQVLDLANPANPVLAGSFKAPGPARDVTISGNLILVAVSGARQPAEAGSQGTGSQPGVVILRRTRE